MAAPMLAQSVVNKKTLKKIVAAEVLILFSFICIVFITFNSQSQVDIIVDSLLSSKLISAAILGLHGLFQVFLLLSTKYTDIPKIKPHVMIRVMNKFLFL